MNRPAEPSLDSLIARSALGDRAAFAELYRRAAPQLFAVTLRILKNREQAEEALQDAFVNAWRRADSFDPAKGAAMAWLVGIARNRALDLVRQRRSQESLDDAEASGTLPASAPEQFDQVARNAENRRLMDCMERLEPRQREAILRAYFDGLTHEALAARIAAPLGTVKSWIRRGLARIKECLEA